MVSITHVRQLGLAAVVVFGLTSDAVAAGDRAIVRGRVESVDLPTRQVKVQTVGGEDLTLTVGDMSQMSLDGKKVTLDQLPRGRRVRVTYEKAGAVNRIVTLRTAVSSKADLSRDIREATDAARKYAFDQKEEYEEKMRGVIDDVDDRIDDLRAQSKDAKADAKVKLDDRIKDLQQKRDDLAKRLDRAKPAAADAWEELKSGISGAADDLGKAIDRFRDDRK